MGFYETRILPHLVRHACGLERIRRQRERVVPLARGRVLEIGLGAGHNLALYDPARVSQVWGLEPSAQMRRLAEPAARTAGVDFEFSFLDAPGEHVPLPDGSVDTVVVTYTLCTVPDPEAVVREMARVLRPGGEVLFCEHGVAPDASVRRWQDRITPIWKRLAGGCHLNRNPRDLIAAGGFDVSGVEAGYVPGWRPASYNYWGRCARR
jgi:ubiquinone/menaquinone biosynthesis C-methylase UbiE